MEKLRPGVELKMSNHWFDRFKSRYEVSLRRPLRAAETVWYTLRTLFNNSQISQKNDNSLTELRGVRQGGIVVPWELLDIPNMD